MESIFPESLLCVWPVGKCASANTIRKHFLQSEVLDKGQRFALKALEVLLSRSYSRLVDILHKAGVSVSRKIPYLNVQTGLLIKTGHKNP